VGIQRAESAVSIPRKREVTSITLGILGRERPEALVADENASRNYVWRAGVMLLSADGLDGQAIKNASGVERKCVALLS
jgi:hypothetical protein